jgi:hypothetical protein
MHLLIGCDLQIMKLLFVQLLLIFIDESRYGLRVGVYDQLDAP